MAVVAFAALAICLVLAGVSASAKVSDDKTRSRAERALREGDYELAEKLFREMLSKSGRDDAARLGLSYTLLKRRQLQDAYDHAARVIASDPLSARAHALLGSVVLATGDFRMAVEEFKTALSLKDNDALAIAGLAMVDLYENRLEKSMEGLRRAIALDANEPDYVYDLALASARNERYKEAADAYERFLSIAPRTDEDRRARIRGLIDFLRYLGRQTGLYRTDGAANTVVPIETTDKDSRPIVKVRVNGSKAPLRFVLDTGSGVSVISEETARRLGISAVARGGMARAVGGGGRFEIVYGFLQSLEIGEARVVNVPVYIRRFYDEKKVVDGYIGLAVISKYISTIDYGARTFSLMRQRTVDNMAQWRTLYRISKPDPAPPKGMEIPIRTTLSGFLSGEVQIEGFDKPQNFIIDTGASISVVSEALMASVDATRFAQGERMRVYGAAGVAEGVQTLVLPRVMLGPHAREKVFAAVLDLQPINETTGFEQTGIIGGNFLRSYRVTFDFQRAIMLLEPLKAVAPQVQSPTNIPASAAQP